MNQQTHSNPTGDNFDGIDSVEHLTQKPKVSLNKKAILSIVGIFGIGASALAGIGYFAYQSLSSDTTESKTVSVAKPIENSGTAQDGLSFEQPVTNTPPGMPVNVVADAQTAVDPQLSQAEAEAAARDEQLLNQRYKSGIVIQGGNGNGVVADGSDPSMNKQVPPELAGIFGSMGMNQNGGQGQNNQQTQSVTSQGGRFGGGSDIAPSANAKYIDNREYKILQGKIIKANMVTAVKSDIPGQIIAQVSEPVYGEQGRYQLLPAGTRLFGEYSAVIRYGQAEVAAQWNRAITPQGIQIMLNSPSANGLGIAGLGGGSVNNHFFQTFGTAALLSLIGVGAETVGADAQDRNNSIANVRNAIAQSFQESANNQLKQRQNIPPTITIEQGSNIVVIVAKDLDFSSLFTD